MYSLEHPKYSGVAPRVTQSVSGMINPILNYLELILAKCDVRDNIFWAFLLLNTYQCFQACQLGEIHPRIIQIRGYEKCPGKCGNFGEIERKASKSANFMKTTKNLG